MFFGKKWRWAFKTFTRNPRHLAATGILIFCPGFGTGALLTCCRYRFGSGGQIALKRFEYCITRLFGRLQRRQFCAQFRLVPFQFNQLRRNRFRLACNRIAFCRNLRAALVHLGDPPFGFARPFLPAADFCLRDGAPFAILPDFLVER